MSSTSTRGGCPVCKAALGAVASQPIAERECPRCLAALWSVDLPSAPVFCVRRPDQTSSEFLSAFTSSALGISRQEACSLLIGADRFDLNELLSEIDTAIGILGPKGEASVER